MAVERAGIKVADATTGKSVALIKTEVGDSFGDDSYSQAVEQVPRPFMSDNANFHTDTIVRTVTSAGSTDPLYITDPTAYGLLDCKGANCLAIWGTTGDTSDQSDHTLAIVTPLACFRNPSTGDYHVIAPLTPVKLRFIAPTAPGSSVNTKKGDVLACYGNYMASMIVGVQLFGVRYVCFHYAKNGYMASGSLDIHAVPTTQFMQHQDMEYAVYQNDYGLPGIPPN